MNEYASHEEPLQLRIERHLPGPIERVWAYITEPEKRSQWLAGGHMELQAGGIADLHFNHENITSEPTPERFKSENEAISHGHVTRCEPPHLLAFTWWENDGDSEIIIQLSESEGGVNLALTHLRLSNRAEVVLTSGGWHAHLGILEDLLNGQDPRPFWSTFEALEAEYEKRIPAEA